MRVSFMYMTCALIWGSQFFAMKNQAGVVSGELSVAYRLALADIVFFGLLIFDRSSKRRLAVRDHIYLIGFGLCNFAIGYSMLYIAAGLMASGLVTVIFSTKVIMTPIACSVLLKQQFEQRVIIGGLLGLFGIVLILGPQFSARSFSLSGVLLATGGTLVIALGDVFSARNAAIGIEPLRANAYGFLYAAAVLLAVSSLRGENITFDTSPAYVWSLTYLVIMSSVVAWLIYLSLISRIGPSAAGYVVVLFPAIGVTISALFEGFTVGMQTVIGISCTLLGNLVAMAGGGRSFRPRVGVRR